MNESEKYIKSRFPNVNLHDITKGKICLSTGQLKKIIEQDKRSNEYFFIKCEKKLIEKQGKSLDFYDVTMIMDKVQKRESVQLNKIKISGNLGNLGNLDIKAQMKSLEEKVENLEQQVFLLKSKQSEEENSSFITFKPKQSMNIEEKIKNIEEKLKNIEEKLEFDDYLLKDMLKGYSCDEVNILLKETEENSKSFKERIENLEKRQTDMDKIINYFKDKIKEEKKDKEEEKDKEDRGDNE